MAQRWPAPKPRLAQEEFDDAVKTNVEDFDMSPEEAVKAAVEEFTVQGYDLSGVLKQAGGGNTQDHPITQATAALESSLSDAAKLQPALQQLHDALMPGTADTQEQNAVALKAKSLKPVLQAVASLSSASSETTAAETTAATRTALLLALALARQLLSLSLEIRDLFDEEGVEGGALAVKLLEAHTGDREVQAAVAGLAEAAALKEEQNKESLVNAGFGAAALALVSEVVSARPAASAAEGDAASASSLGEAEEQLLVNCCGALRLLVTADDDRPPSSAAFKNARTLAKEAGAAGVLLAALRRCQETRCQAGACATLAALKQFAANDDICKEVAEGGGVLAALAALGAWPGNADVVRAALGALRQLSNSDTIKKVLAESGGIDKILGIISSHPSTDDVLEPALGLLTNIMLRLPEVAAKAAEAGAIDVVIEVMGARPAAAQVQRQGCMALRNMSVRNPELRPVILEKGGEPLLRQAKIRHPKTCGDVGAAALRDLGLDNYNDDATLLHPERMVY